MKHKSKKCPTSLSNDSRTNPDGHPGKGATPNADDATADVRLARELLGDSDDDMDECDKRSLREIVESSPNPEGGEVDDATGTEDATAEGGALKSSFFIFWMPSACVGA